MQNRKYLNFSIAVESILANKTRAMLTALGIIFGVSAVIAMLAIGTGAKQEILEQIKLVGANNIVITPVKEQKEGKVKEEKADKKEAKKFTPGLTLEDLKSILEVVPNIEKITSEIVIETDFVYQGIRRTGKLVGTQPEYFDITNFLPEEGALFNTRQMNYGEPVCVIGQSIKTKFFSRNNPVGQYIKCGSVWLKVIGVLQERVISESTISNLGIRDYNMDIYIPVKTMLIRYTNRALINQSKIMSASMYNGDTPPEKPSNYHQLDKIIVKVEQSEYLMPTADIIARLMARHHNGVTDFEIQIPELMLKQQQRTKDIFNIVLGLIAGISLLVGGIGIMNIMLASVLERTKEIGIRLSLGATPHDVVQQFLFEAILISISGGFIGVVLGIILSYLVSGIAEIQTIITFWSVLVSFSVAALTGLIFGINPARKAALQDPIKSLRYE
ncbi:MAG: ABC transporter permease [Bacteroidia bacterium]